MTTPNGSRAAQPAVDPTDLDNALGILRSLAHRIDRENRDLAHQVKKVSAQYLDALDEVHALREQIRVKDQMIEELQALTARRRK